MINLKHVEKEKILMTFGNVKDHAAIQGCVMSQ